MEGTANSEVHCSATRSREDANASVAHNAKSGRLAARSGTTSRVSDMHDGTFACSASTRGLDFRLLLHLLVVRARRGSRVDRHSQLRCEAQKRQSRVKKQAGIGRTDDSTSTEEKATKRQGKPKCDR